MFTNEEKNLLCESLDRYLRGYVENANRLSLMKALIPDAPEGKKGIGEITEDILLKERVRVSLLQQKILNISSVTEECVADPKWEKEQTSAPAQ